jgi:hypothetical protein
MGAGFWRHIFESIPGEVSLIAARGAVLEVEPVPGLVYAKRSRESLDYRKTCKKAKHFQTRGHMSDDLRPARCSINSFRPVGWQILKR